MLCTLAYNQVNLIMVDLRGSNGTPSRSDYRVNESFAELFFRLPWIQQPERNSRRMF